MAFYQSPDQLAASAGHSLIVLLTTLEASQEMESVKQAINSGIEAVTSAVTSLTASKILFVLTSHSSLKNGKPTGWYLPEAAHPYYVLKDAGYAIDFASPKGGAAPLDPGSVEMFKSDGVCQKFLNDPTAQQQVKSTKLLSEIQHTSYAAIFYVGGHGPCFDLATDVNSLELAGKFWDAGKVVSAVCHGPAALTDVRADAGKGDFIVKGRRVTCFSNDEEEQVKLTDQIPFLVETRLKEHGGIYEKNSTAWQPWVSVDGQLITGANPASGHALGEALVKALKS